MNLNQIINEKRCVSAEYHVIVARAWKQHGQANDSQSPLVYAAFEYRCAIERVVFELYGIMHNELPGDEISNQIGSFSGLVKQVHDLAGGNKKKLYRVLKFNSIVSEFMCLHKTMSVPDVGKLQEFWSKASNYCHQQIIPNETWKSPEWVRKGYKLLDRVDRYLQEILFDHLFGAMSEKKMPAEVIDAKKAFVTEEIDEAGLRNRLKLMEPVLELRFRQHHAD